VGRALPPSYAEERHFNRATELLTASRTHARRGLYWTPHPASAGCSCDGTLEITKGKKGTRYTLTEIPVGAGFGNGRGFQLAKEDGTVYSLYVGTDRTDCDCPGKCYEATEKADRRHGTRSESLGCCHLDAVVALLANNWLPDPRTNPGQDVSNTEADEQELPECFRDVGHGESDRCPF
jgi:hypothetical protein